MKRFTIVVTGATKGLGREITLAAVAQGHQVLGLYAADETAAERLRSELIALGGSSRLVRHDITVKSDEVWESPEILEAESLVLINNACAPFAPQPFHLLEWEDFGQAGEVAVKGSWRCARALLRPMLRKGGGTMVSVLTAALEGLPPKGFAAYAVAKHAQRGLTLALASEYADKGLRVFSVSPGFMATPLTAGWDARLVAAARAGGRVSDPAVAARRILELVEGAAPGQGEDYAV